MSALDACGDSEHVARVHERILAAARDGLRLSEWVEIEAAGLAPARRAYLKGSPLVGKARLRHGVRERILARAPPRLAEFANLAWLRAHGFRAPCPLAAGVVRGPLGLVAYQFLLTEEVRDSATLDRALQGAASDARETCLAALGTDVARLHAAGFVHRDLYPRNLLVAGDPARGRIWFVDAWRGGARPQLRGPDYDHACLMLRGAEHFTPAEQASYFDAYFAERERRGRILDRARHLAAVARERVALARRFG